MKKSEKARYKILKAWQGVRMLTDDEQEELKMLEMYKRFEGNFKTMLSAVILATCAMITNIALIIIYLTQ